MTDKSQADKICDFCGETFFFCRCQDRCEDCHKRVSECICYYEDIYNNIDIFDNDDRY